MPPQPLAQGLALEHLAQRGPGRGDRRRRRRGGEDVGPAHHPQQLEVGMAAEAEAADAAQALGEGADQEVDVVEQAELLAEAQAARPEHAERMRLVDQQPGAVALLDLDDLAQRRAVAAGAVQALDHHQGAAGVGAEAGRGAGRGPRHRCGGSGSWWRCSGGSRRGCWRGCRHRSAGTRRCRPGRTRRRDWPGSRSRRRCPRPSRRRRPGPARARDGRRSCRWPCASRWCRCRWPRSRRSPRRGTRRRRSGRDSCWCRRAPSAGRRWSPSVAECTASIGVAIGRTAPLSARLAWRARCGANLSNRLTTSGCDSSQGCRSITP